MANAAALSMFYELNSFRLIYLLWIAHGGLMESRDDAPSAWWRTCLHCALTPLLLWRGTQASKQSTNPEAMHKLTLKLEHLFIKLR